MYAKKAASNKKKNKIIKNKFTSYEIIKFAGACYSNDFNSNNNAERKCILLQQNC